ncbi:MAG TPA: NHL repeat-containing protein, partial [Candidatus Eisenbacteria bacterium]|nr:NHL repeat-containing protein [Candidatus Eisenbacteria bacterium]
VTPQSRPLIHIFSSAGQFIERWELSYSTGSVKDMVIAADGTVYANDAFGRIIHLGPSGTVLQSWGAGDGLNGTANPFANDIALGNDELLYVPYSAGHIVRIFDRDGNIIRSWGRDTPFYPGSIVLDSSGFIYVSEYDRMYKFTSDGSLVKSWDIPRFQTRALYDRNLAVMENGDILLIQEDTAVHRFTSDGVLTGSWSGEGPLMAGYASDIETDPARGRVLTLGLRGFGVEAYTEDGRLLDTIGEPPSSVPGQFYYPARIAVTADRSVVVRDGFRIQRFSAEGVYQDGWNLFSVPELFSTDIASTPDGSILVGVGDGIRKYSPDGEVLGEWSSGLRFFNARGMDCDESGRIWVTDSLRDRLIVLSETWEVLEYWGIPGDAPGKLFAPQVIAVREGYVALSDRNGLQVFSQDGDFLAHLGEISARRLAIAGGKLFVSDTGGNVSVFSLAQIRMGLGASEIGEIPHHGGETRPFFARDLAATPEGDVYVLSPVLGQVFQYRFGEAPAGSPTDPGTGGIE